jgi:protein arginine kinase
MIQLPKSLLEHTPWEKESNPIWLATSFLLHRNLEKFNFPSKMEDRQFPLTFSSVKDQLLQSPLLKQPMILKAEEIGAIDKEYLFEHFLCMEGFQNTLAGQGFIVDETGNFFAKLNIEDHLQLKLLDTEGAWEKAWNHLNEIETAIGSALEFSFSPKFGYLTADPTYCGTGLTVQAFLHLPALIHTGQLKETLANQKEEDATVTGIRGDLDEIAGDLVVVSNTFTLGTNEESILKSVHSMAMKLMAIEKTLRSHLKNENNAEIKDLVSRSFGLLLHSYQLQTKEALGALSLMKLGLNLDWIEGISDAKLSTLFFQCRRAHLLHLLNEQQLVDPQEIARKRAEFLHKNMQGAILKIEAKS